MNPFDFQGPAFLLFYLMTGAVVCVAVFLIVRALEAGEAPKMRVSDPYLLAYLRGRSRETLQVALLAMIDRRLLRVDDDMISVADKATRATHPVEAKILERFQLPGAVQDLFTDDRLKEAADSLYQPELEGLGLLPDAPARRLRTLVVAAALAILIGIAAIKWSVALSRGRSNVQFLLVEAAGFALVLVGQTQKTRTARGDAALADLRRLLGDLHTRVAGSADNASPGQRALLAAVFGLGVLSDSIFAQMRHLLRRASQRTEVYSSSCGSGGSGGSACGSSCGSSCGGGCGGGCGGCGS